jgi:hypothetical protein
MRHPPPCQFDSGFSGIDPATDFCTCPKTTKDEGYRKWLVDRIGTTNGRMLQAKDNVYEAVALSGQLTAFKQMLNYVKTHGIA